MISRIVSDKKSNAAYVTYSATGLRGTLYVPKSWIDGEAPDVLDVNLSLVVPSAQKTTSAKMTPEERKAHMAELAERRKNMTPAEKVEAKRKKLEKEQAALAKLEAEMAAGQ